MVDIVNQIGECKSFRLFLDAGSQAHFITEEAASMVNLDRQQCINPDLTNAVKFSSSWL